MKENHDFSKIIEKYDYMINVILAISFSFKILKNRKILII